MDSADCGRLGGGLSNFSAPYFVEKLRQKYWTKGNSSM